MLLVQQSVEMKRGPECLLEDRRESYMSSCSCFCYKERILFSWRQNSVCKRWKGEMRTLTPENAAFLSAVVFSLQLHCWRKISTICGIISHSKPWSMCTSICLFKIFQPLFLVMDSQQLEKKPWFDWQHWAVTGRSQRGRKKRRKKRTCRTAAGPQVSHESTSKIKMDSVVLTYTNLHLFVGAALKHHTSPAQAASAIRMQRWAPQPHRVNYLKI